MDEFRKNPRDLLRGESVDWVKFGWFSVPALEEHALEEASEDTRCVSLRGFANTKLLPAFLKVNADWVLSNNWSLRGATLSTPPGEKHPYHLKLNTLWDDDEEFGVVHKELEVDEEAFASVAEAKAPSEKSAYQVSDALAKKLAKAWKS